MSSDALSHRRTLLGAALAALLPWPAAAALVLPAGQLKADGIPAFERHNTASDAPEAQGVRFLDWHPLRAEMLVLYRHGGSQQLHRVAAAGAKPEPLTQGRDAVSGARWEPSAGAYLVFSRDQGGDEAFRLFRLVPGSEPQALTPAGERVSEFEFLPRAGGLVCLQEQLNREGGTAATSRSSLWWIDPQQPDSRRLVAEVRGARYTDLRVSAGGRIVATLTRGGRSQAQAFTLDGKPPVALGGASSEAGSELDDDDSAARPAMAASAAADAPDLLWRRQAVQGEFRHLVRVDAGTGRRSNLLVNERADLEALAAPADGRPLALVYNVDGISELAMLAADGQAVRRVARDLPPGVLRGPRWHPRLPLLGFSHVSADSPGRLYVWSLQDEKLNAWSAAASGAPLRASVLRWNGFDGLPLSGLHLAPPAHFTGPRPVYISIHGGPASQARPGYVSGVTRILVEQLGMHVIEPNVRGSDGFGRSFLKLDNGRLRENSVRDISTLLDLVASRPDMDASRVIVVGGSYGGYMSLAVATQESKRILGSICRVGISNFVSFLEHTEIYRRDNRRAEYGDERDPSMREFLQQISPLARADAVRKPLFVVHGRNDPRVPWGEAEGMVRAVRAAGTPVWFLTADDEGHSFGNADNRSYLTQATLEFVTRLLEGKSLQ
ncbi:prolyl oligopeptidase family serine peptidase [Roseateles asaccharophilus]|uniref:Dipeptidyl aminopeptidase/acylaminoacyl peptidase n=1 Tax=Roseateles asaccharophilus TaxID=582607 RepID=A0ABU2ACD3_9BURK|nr:prolyl oligopeptidase family serine peptidase [Roseateles asaccharophilus]MDR7334859.1 dipeptidyl aminopeptidase/acylaminoacyl peptidase [Roseateles asaccharophilus]